MQPTPPSAGAHAPRPGWYPDPWQIAPNRWWDGIAWTGFTSSPTAPPAPSGPASYGPGPHTPISYPPTSYPIAPYGTTAVLPAARDDIRDGGIAILGYVAALVLSLVCAKVAEFAGMQPLTVPNLVISEFGLWVGLCGAAYVVTHRRAGGTLADLGFHAPTGQEIGVGIGVGIVGLVIATRVAIALRALFPDNGGSHLFVSNTPSYSLVLVVGLLACVGAPIVEELYFRGLVQSVLTRDLGSTPAIILQAGLFGLAHFQLGMTFNEAAVRCGTVMVLGLFNGWLRANTGRLGAGMVAHATYNTIVTVTTLIAIARVTGH